MYWLPKLHKHPTGSRFITAALKYSAKSLPKTLASILRLFFKQIKVNKGKCTFFSGVVTFSSFKQSASDRCHQQNQFKKKDPLNLSF